ncbi:DNA primase OS=Streptomyces griseomycini OX=66895 GN=FHS37_001350 PE=4 SV=1 [Streptomyces griseomycini]
MLDEDAATGAALRRHRPTTARTPRRPRNGRRCDGDTAEALAYLIDPFGLVGEVPGVELQQASWSGERIDYDPDSPERDLDE